MTFYLLAVVALVFPFHVSAQAPPVPAAFQPIYTEMNNYLVNFNATLPPGNIPAYPTLMTGSLKFSNANTGAALVIGMTGSQLPPGVQLQLNALKAMGAQAIMVEVGFPMLYEPFLTSVGQTQSTFVAYYQAVAAAVRAAGLKLVVENDTLLTNNVSAGWDVAPFYATLNWTQYQQARAQTAVTIAQIMQPDYLVVVEEPDTEAANSNQSNVNTPSGDTAMLSQILTSLQQAGVPNMQVGAGVGSWLNNSLEFIQGFVALPVDFIDFHIYPINDSFLPNALQIVSTAAAAGKPVAMTECWLSKELDTEAGEIPNSVVQGRNPFSFWAPLDALFIQTMQNLANSSQMLFLDPFNAEYFFSYLSYDDSTENQPTSWLISMENQNVSVANQTAQYTSTGLSYYNSIVVPADTIPPSAPTGLSGGSGNPTIVGLTWNAATDNIGVAGYNIYRNNTLLSPPTTYTYFQDTGLTEATTYTYMVQAFDLAGNTTNSVSINVTTTDTTPPTPPGNVAVKIGACTKATVTWSASTDNTGVAYYVVYMGISPNALSQVAMIKSPTLTYSNYTLSPATTYYVSVAAQDKSANVSYLSTPVAFTTPALPVAPSSVLATPAATTKVSVSWSASTGGLPISYYFVYRGTSPSGLSKVATVSTASYSDMSATPATTYYYAVQSQDTGLPPAQSGLSAPVSTTTYALPTVPANLTATAESCTKVALAWSAATSGLGIANYRLYKGTSPTNLVQLVITTKTSYTDTADSGQTMYYYAVQSADNGKPQGLSAISAPVSITTVSDPSVPANLIATPVSSSKITLTWSPSTPGGLPIGYYHVYRGTSPSNLSQIAVTSSTTYNNLSLTPGTSYYYAVQAVDTALDASALCTAVPAVTFPLPTTPAGVTAQGTKTTQIALSWLPSSGNLSIAHYFIFRGSSPSNMSQVATALTTSYKDNSVSPGATYYYGVQAADTAGDLSAISTAVAGSSQQ
jgi:fibronectin type 3 domain-containing protein